MHFDFDMEKWLAVLSHYPDLIALLVGSLVGYVFTAMVEMYFLPIYTDPVQQRRQQGLTFLLCWFTSAGASTVLWTFIDHGDPMQMRIWISVVVGVLSFAGYPLVARVATSILKRFGIELGSAWTKAP
jgi:hypothetical protein